MSRKPKNFAIGATFALALMLFIFWLGGYDFNYRGPDVAVGAMITLCLCVFFGMIATEILP